MSESLSGPHPRPADAGVEDEYFESLGPGKGIYATIGEDGFVEFKINTEGTGVRGTDLFNRMMRAFGGRVRGIWGMWPRGTNLDRVNELTALGVPLTEAVTRTWTAHRARDFGFARAVIHGEPPGGLHESRRPIRQGVGSLMIGRGDE
jgi:hypothetical protein